MSERISKADAEFQNGNFEIASKLYAELLAELESDDTDNFKDQAALLQKLADSDYALSKYSDARENYERLVALLDAQSFSDKEKVQARLKLAKCSDKCEAHDQAELNFQTAYDLATSALSAKHFLRRTVSESYVEWLRETGRNPDRLVTLEDELGIKRAPEEAEPQESDKEDAAESISSRAEGQTSREQEYTVMRSKITALKRKKGMASPDPEQEAATASEKKSLKTQEKTIDTKVAERKFLRKGEEKTKTDQLSSQRAKLRNALTGPRKHTQENETGDPALDRPESEESALAGQMIDESGHAGSTMEAPGTSSWADEHARFDNEQYTQEDSRFATGSFAGMDAQSPPVVQAAGETRYAEELRLADEVRAKFIGMKPQRRLEEPGDAARRKKKGVDLTIPEESAGTPESSLIFLRQSQAIRKASGEDIEAPDMVPLRDEARVVPPVSKQIVDSLRFAPPLIGVVLVIAVAAILYHFACTEESTLPPFVAEALDKNYTCADGALSLNLESPKSKLSGTGTHRNVKTRIWRGDWKDELKLLGGEFKDCKWLTVMPGALRDEQGVTFYEMSSPERQVIAIMNRAGDDAQQLYQKSGSYPSYPSEITNDSYTNPFTNRLEAVLVKSGVDENSDESHDTQLDIAYEHGEPFKNEEENHPGSVHGYGVIGHPQRSPDQINDTWRTHCFYIHGCDRNGELIRSSIKDQIYLITLKNGIKKPVDNATAAADYGACDICLTQAGQPSAGFVMIKYAIAGGVLIAIAIFMCRASILEAMQAYLAQKPGSDPHS